MLDDNRRATHFFSYLSFKCTTVRSVLIKDKKKRSKSNQHGGNENQLYVIHLI